MPPPNKSYRPGSHLLAASIKTTISSHPQQILSLSEESFPFVLLATHENIFASWGKNLSESEFRGRH